MVTPPSVRSRLAWLVSLLGMATAASPAAALTIFDFDDFPPNPGLNPPGGPNAVNTTVYGCRGKSFCTNEDIGDARENAISSISTTRRSIDAVFERPGRSFPAGIGVFPQSSGPDSFLNPGNVENTGDFVEYVAHFSKELVFAQVEIAPNEDDPIGDFAFLEAYADGTVVRTEAPLTQGTWSQLSISAPGSKTFDSIRFGVGFDIPGCESGCLLDNGGAQGFADNVVVEAVPEPTSALLFGVAMGAASVAFRRTGRRLRT